MRYSEDKKLDYLINLALLDCGDKDYEMFMSIDETKVVVDENLNKKVFRLIRRKEREQKAIKVRRVAVMAAIITMLIMSVCFVTIMAIEPIRNAIWNTIIEWHDDYISVKYEPETEQNQATEPEEQPSTEKPTDEIIIIPPTTIEEVRKPTYTIEGAQEISFSNSTMAVSEYYVGEDLAYMFTQYLLKESEKYFDSESAQVTSIDVNGHTGTLLTYSEKTEMSLIWNDGEYVYVLLSYALGREEIINIAKSVP